MAKTETERALSNVAKLFLAAIDDKDGQEAVKRYIPGVGTPYRYANGNISPNEDKGGSLGLGFGAGGEMRLDAALYEFRRTLEIDWGTGALPHVEWVTLSVFGFSRGATLARTFVRRLIAEQCERTADGHLMWTTRYDKPVRLRIVFMGLFDTVASVGGPGLHMSWGSELAIPAGVERCLHFVSAHEVRQAFPLDSVRVGSEYPEKCEEVIYPGVHSDVGGGYFDGFQGRSNVLSRIPLRDMYAEALISGVMLRRLSDAPLEVRDEIALPADAPLLQAYKTYMASLPAANDDSLESLLHAHRVLKFRWRAAITRENNDIRVLGALHRRVDPTLCDTVGAQDNHRTCSPTSWTYELPRKPDVQAKQLLAEHRRLLRQMPAIREPVEWQGDAERRRERNAYEDLIIATWDDQSELPEEVGTFMAEHVHDSVAHFTDWPCALHDPRAIFCDETRILAEREKRRSTAHA
ncbi:T6SS phospholipase effector Tle1-like catalytic domain-containing protein [Aromatoleum toluclasticum]|uniref:T6SS phospholipase effector Tle1-like catalytic domain-containing protein n=1 Tax=Aromatoleum toluclasticum TaxID=92003 RepID=UPI003F68E683